METQVKRWFALTKQKDMISNSKNYGEVKLEIFFTDTFKRGLDKAQVSAKSSPALDKAAKTAKTLQNRHGEDSGELKLKITFLPPLGNWIGRLNIAVLEARGLPSSGDSEKISAYVTIKFNKFKNVKRTKAIESSSNPTWTHNNCFHFPIKEGEALAGLIHGKVYAENTLFGDTLVGELEIAMDELNLDTKVVNWFQLRSYGTTAPLLDGVKLATELKKQGYKPDYPVFLFPGLASSALQVLESPKSDWVGERVWLSLNRVVSSIRALPTPSPRKKKSKHGGKTTEGTGDEDYEDEELQAETPSISRASSKADDNRPVGRASSSKSEEPTDSVAFLGRADTSVPAGRSRSNVLTTNTSDPKSTVLTTRSSRTLSKHKSQGGVKHASSRNGVNSDGDSSGEEDDDDDGYGEQNAEYHSAWINHLCLASDSVSDPPGVKTRPIESFDGCSYLAESGVAKSMSYVLAPLIQNLEELGYEKFHNFFAFTYDWRLPLHINEQRDQLFTRMKRQLEDTFVAFGKPSVVIGHSMGNRLLQYFSYWIEDTVGVAWLHKHIHIWFAAGAPWLGAPKMLRAVISGDDLGIMVVAKRDSLAMSRSNGSSPALFPVEEENYFESLKVAGIQTDGFVFQRVDKGSDPIDISSKSIIVSKGGSKIYKPIPYKTLWQDLGLPQIEAVVNKHYLYNDLYGGPSPKYDMRILHAPPVKRLVNIYGINLDTEKFFFYKKRGDTFVLDTKASVTVEGYSIHEGIAFECANTPQHELKAAGLQNYRRSGDGTVPYESLAYPSYHWTKQIEKIDTVEIVNAEHRNLVSTKTFLNVLVSHICTKQ